MEKIAPEQSNMAIPGQTIVEGRERSQSKTEPSTASTVSPSQSRESRFDGDTVGETAGSATAGDARPADIPLPEARKLRHLSC